MTVNFEQCFPPPMIDVSELLFPVPPTTQPDMVNHPPHYADGWSNGAQLIDITEHLNFNRGNVVKYTARAGKKSEDELEDLKKAKWYLEREIARLG